MLPGSRRWIALGLSATLAAPAGCLGSFTFEGIRREMIQSQLEALATRDLSCPTSQIVFLDAPNPPEVRLGGPARSYSLWSVRAAGCRRERLYGCLAQDESSLPTCAAYEPLERPALELIG